MFLPVVHAFEVAWGQEVCRHGVGVPWGSMEVGVQHMAASQVGDVWAFPYVQDLKDKKKQVLN